MSPPEPLAALAGLAEHDAWLVGGAVRDRMLARDTADFDVATAGPPGRLARALAKATGAHRFSLSDAFGGWRVVARDRRWQVDVLPLSGASIEDDLRARDLTINAMAEPLAGGVLVDPLGGQSDLARRRLRMVASSAFADDPLRVLRLARIACELEFAIEPDTVGAARAQAPGLARVSAERVFVELSRLLSADQAPNGLTLMDELGITAVVLPELAALRGVEQSKYHHLDVLDHTRAVLAETIALERDPAAVFGDLAPEIEILLREPLANDLTRGQALRIGALLHDAAKPATRAVTAEGRVTFMGHDERGAALAVAVLGRLRASERLAAHVAGLVRHHLRLGFLVHDMPLSRRTLYRYLRTTEPVEADVTLLSVADRLATRGRGADVAIARHLDLARQVLPEALAWRAARPRPPLRGDELAEAVGLAPGPELGRLLAELEEASFAGEILTAEQAIARARELLGGARAEDR
jgi:tRNA nucleotidyltransferase/poly(A) polymerase